MSRIIPNTTPTTMWRKSTCHGCGYVQTTVLSYYQDKKLWLAHVKANHRPK